MIKVVASCEDCGFEKSYSSEPRAWQGLRQHSCARQIKRANRMVRNPAPREKYLYQKRWRADRARGITRLVDATKARNHIWWLRNSMGMSLGHIARSATMHLPEGSTELSRSVIHRLESGKQQKLRATIAKAILAVDPADIRSISEGDETFVPVIGARRRVQALLYLGHRYTDMEALLTEPLQIAATVNHAGRWITVRNHERIKAIYEALWTTPGTSRKTMTIARKRGYMSPLAWGDDIDDPAAVPLADEDVDDDEVVDEMVLTLVLDLGEDRKLSRAELIAAVLRLHDRGLTPHGISKHLHGHVSDARVKQIINEREEEVA